MPQKVCRFWQCGVLRATLDELVRQAVAVLDDMSFNETLTTPPALRPANCEDALAKQDVAYFLIEPCGGFIEQRWAVVQAVAAAYIMHRRSLRVQREQNFWDVPRQTNGSSTARSKQRVRDVVLVLPPFLVGASSRAGARQHFGRIYDVPFLRSFLATLAKPLTVLEYHEVPADVRACATSARLPVNDRSWSIRDFVHRETPAVQAHVAYNFRCFVGATGVPPPMQAANTSTDARQLTGGGADDSAEVALWHTIDVHLRLARPLRVLAGAVMRYLRQFDPSLSSKLSAWNQVPRGPYAVLHLRTDSAWRRFCATPPKPHCLVTARQVDAYVAHKLILLANEPFYVAALNVSMSALTDFTADTITFQADAVPRLREFRALSPHALAGVDFLVALHARVFLGNGYSAFSQEIVRLRAAMRLRRSKSVLYNNEI